MRISEADLPVDAPASREFGFRHSDFTRARKLIYERAGISLGDGKSEMVYSRLAKRVRALGLSDFRRYLAQLEDPSHPEWEHFVNALTTNQTDFFREGHHFPLLAAHAKQIRGRPIRIWSAASATGEEPYSIAITMCEAFATLAPPVRVLATDLDTRALGHARAGIYSLQRLESVAPERLRRFFLKGRGRRTGYARIRDEVRALVEFRPLNLREAAWDVEGPFDAIFCRNVLIYFDKQTQREVLGRLAGRMARDGLYFAGHSESLLHAGDLFAPSGRTVYRLAGGRAA